MMNPEDPERYIRNLERGASQPPGATPPPPLPAPPPSFGTRFTGQFGGPVGGPYSGGSYGSGFGDLGVSRRRGPRMAPLLISVVIVAVGIFMWFMVHASHPSGGSTTPTVQKGGSLHATLEGGGQQTVVCNDGNLHADGDGGTFTVTGHCLALTVTGDNIHVTVDSADTINVEGVDIEVIYHSGSPEINKSGVGTEVSQG